MEVDLITAYSFCYNAFCESSECDEKFILCRLCKLSKYCSQSCQEEGWNADHEAHCQVVEPLHFIDWAPTASKWDRCNGDNLVNFAITTVLEAAFMDEPFDVDQCLNNRDWAAIWNKYTCAVFLTVSKSQNVETRETVHFVKYMAAGLVSINKTLTDYQRIQYAGRLEGGKWPVSVIYFGSDHNRDVKDPPICRYALPSARFLEAGHIETTRFYLARRQGFKEALENAYVGGYDFQLLNI